MRRRQVSSLRLAYRITSRYDPCQEKSPWIEKIRGVLDDFEKIARLTNNKSKEEKFKKLEEIINYVKSASEDYDFTRNFESKVIEVPQLAATNPRYPSFSDSVNVVRLVTCILHITKLLMF